MIVGIGIDIANINRIAKQTENSAFQRKVFTPDELKACLHLKKKAECLAGKFAAKEAFMKAIGMGIRQGIWFTQIEVLSQEKGDPYIQVNGQAEQRLKELEASRILVSISHDFDVAAAVVILEK